MEQRPGVNATDRTAAIVGVQQLCAAYADVITRRAFRELDDLFLPNCPIEIDTRSGEPRSLVGPRAFAAFVEPAMARFDFFEFVVLNVRVGVEAADEARSRLYLCEMRQDRNTGRRSEAFGLYQDRARLVDGAWRFAARRYQSMARTSTTPGERDLEVLPPPQLH
jgi:hypothetical protein